MKKILEVKLQEVREREANGEKVFENEGQRIILQSYMLSQRNYETDLLVLENVIWNQNYESLLQELRTMEIEKVIIANTSTELMDVLHYLLSNGCKIEGAIEVNYKEERVIFEETKKGLVVII